MTLKKIFNTQFILITLLILVVSTFNQCDNSKKPLSDKEVVLAWGGLTTYITQHTPSNSPTFASRAFAYIGLTMYESIVPGYDEYTSLSGQLNELNPLPEPADKNSINWILSLNAAQAEIIKNIYVQTSDENKHKIDSLEQVVFKQYSKGLEPEIIKTSVQYGQNIAQYIFEWSKSDGGHRGYLYNFDKTLSFTDKPGSWKPPLFAQSFSHYPLHPHWGKNRTFLVQNDTIPLPAMAKYDTVPGSPYYNEFMAVYKKDLTLTKAEKEAAIWWGDDPDVTFTPPGHSYYIAGLVIANKQPNVITAAETYAKTAISVADSFILCWRWKYHFFSERPNTFIPKYIDEEWESFWPDPPFPAFPSGHAIQAAAAATALEAIYGKDFIFIDRAHEGRERDEIRDTDFVVREFKSFWEFAQETADSRFYGGIHTPQDNEVGLKEGKRIAENVNALQWKK